jgi:cytochrome c-type biogenesis protein CcmE
MGKNLDRELAEAVGGDDSNEEASMAVPQPPDDVGEAGLGRDRPKRANVGLLVTLLMMGIGIVCLFMFGFKEAAIYSMPVDQFLAQKDQHVDRRVRIDGELVPGSMVKRDKPCEYRFRMMGTDGAQLEVRYPQCIVPDTFRDVPQGGVQVTAEGTIDTAGHFEADLIMAKCSSKYDPDTHTMEQGQEQAKAGE